MFLDFKSTAIFATVWLVFYKLVCLQMDLFEEESQASFSQTSFANATGE